MMKQIRVFVISMLASLVIAACGGGGGGGSSSDNGTPVSGGGAGSVGGTGGGSGGGGTGGGDTGGDGGGDTGGDMPEGRVFSVSPGPDASENALIAAAVAVTGDVIEFECGFYDMRSTLQVSSKEDIVIRGSGRDCTVLSFRNNNLPEGILIDNVRGIVIEDLTVADSAGNGFELRSVDHATLRNVRAFWSSGGGRESPDPISSTNYTDGRMNVQCTQPALRDPDVPENQLPNGDPVPEATSPDYTVSDKAGRYGIYPVKSQNVLVEFSESIGASDAGIYVGQTNRAIIRNSRAVYNVFGFEIENVQGGEYANNVAECNTGGFLIYDLDNITQYGERSRMHGNVSNMNNTYNFTEGGIVADVPPGSGMITLAYDRIDVFDNDFTNNNTGGIIHASYQLFPEGAGRPDDRKIDFYTEGMRIFNNRFANNGNNLPEPTTTDLQNQDVARLLPALVGAKTLAACATDVTGACPVDTVGGYRGAHIVWDGLLPEYDPDCPYPTVNGEPDGEPVPARADGKPIHTNEHANPSCHYNEYKFDVSQAGNPRIVPEWFSSCIDANNEFAPDSLAYTNFNGTRGIEAALIAATDPADLFDPTQLLGIVTAAPDFPADLDWTPHQCVQEYGRNLALLPPVVIPPFERSENAMTAPTEEEILAACDVDMPPGEVNFGAVNFDCPRLDHYNLFSDPEDPTSDPNGNGTLDNASNGLPFVLNTKLFSDYSVKYRVLFLPSDEDGNATLAGTYIAPGAAEPNATMVFPAGTIIAKTFSFAEQGQENHVETRLLIKRDLGDGRIRWAGLPYIWAEEDGEQVARLTVQGGTSNVSWDYEDVDTGDQLVGNAPEYSIPNVNQCLSCHANQDREGGSPPIGTKVRNLNRPYQSESMVVTDQSMHPIAGVNQIKYMCDNDYLMGCPSEAAFSLDVNTQYAQGLERSPRYKVPGDSGETPGSDSDIESRARAWLEVNCQHCHNPQGFAANTGYFLDVFRVVNAQYGICKGPTATGAIGSGGRSVDILPGDASGSIVEFRISEQATEPAARMPPIARSVVNTEGHGLIEQWINDVIVADEARYPGSTSCTDDGGAMTPALPVP